MAYTVNKRISSPIRQNMIQSDFSSGINAVDNEVVLKESHVNFAKNLDLTTENRLEKRSGYITKYTRTFKENFEKEHPDLGKITGNIKGNVQAYHKFIQADGIEVEFFCVSGIFYKYPFTFENAPSGVRWEMYTIKDWVGDVKEVLVNQDELSFQKTRRFDIRTINDMVIFATGTRILTYDLNKKYSSSYRLRTIIPYKPLLEEYLNISYGQNLLAPYKYRQRYFNLDLIGTGGFLGIITDPNILYPSSEPVKFIPLGKLKLSTSNISYCEIMYRQVQAEKKYIASENVLVQSRSFVSDGNLDLDKDLTYTEMKVGTTNPIQVLGFAYNPDAAYERYNLHNDSSSPLPAPKKQGDELPEVSKFLMNYRNNYIKEISFSRLSSSSGEGNNGTNFNIDVQVKFPDRDDYITIGYIQGGQNSSFLPIDFGNILLYDIDDIKCIVRSAGGSYTSYYFSIYCLKEKVNSSKYALSYKQVMTPKLQEYKMSPNSNYINECTRIFYKNGYIMLYGGDPKNRINKANTIFVSDINRPTYFPQYSTIDIPTEGSQRIQSIESWNTEVENVIFLENSIYDFKFKTVDEASISPITTNIGLIAPYSVSPADNKLYFLAKDGVWSLTTVQYSNTGINTKLVSDSINPLIVGNDNLVSKDAVAYTKGNKYYLVIPKIDDYDGTVVNRQFKLYTDSKNPCWYMDQGKFLNFALVYSEGSDISFISNNELNILKQQYGVYVDGDYENYIDYDMNSGVVPVDKSSFDIYRVEFKSKAYDMKPYNLHKKKFRNILVEIGMQTDKRVESYAQNINLIVSGYVDGYESSNKKEIYTYIENGQVKIGKREFVNNTINAGTMYRYEENKSGTFIWNQSKWGKKTSSLNVFSNFGQGRNVAIEIKQKENEAAGFSILSISVEYKVAQIVKNI